MKASPEMKDLLIKYFIPNLKESFNADYFQFTERKNEDYKSYYIKIQDLCKEEKLPENVINVLYYAGLHFKEYYLFKGLLKEGFSRKEEALLQLTEAVLLIVQIMDNNIEEVKIQLSYKKSNYHKSHNTIKAEITDKEILNKFIFFITNLYLSEENKIKAPGYKIEMKDKISKEYLIKLKKELKKIKNPGKPQSIKYLFELIKKLQNILNEETSLKSNTKIISQQQAIFIYNYLKIMGFINHNTELEEDKGSYIRAIIQ